MRLTEEMAPDVAEIMAATSAALGITSPIETYVYPSAQFNAAAVRPEEGRLFVMFSSSLLEGFSPAELRFVIGHELGHHLFRHHDIPTSLLLASPRDIRPGLALALFAWQRYAEVSCDRAGVVAAGGLEPAATALFKLASGLTGDRVKVRVSLPDRPRGEHSSRSEHPQLRHPGIREFQ
jgi:Zn-dependent protease with chaperone function